MILRRLLFYCFGFAAITLVATGCSADAVAERTATQHTIDSLTELLRRREAEIVVLQTQIGDYKEAVAAADTTRVDSLAADTLETLVVVAQRADSNPDLLLLGTAYYVLGSKTELVHKGVLKRTFPLVGKLYVNPSRRLDATFHRVDTDRSVTFAVNRVGARLVSQHPEGSYRLTTSKSGRFWHDLHVVDPELFWSQTKVLVIAYD